MRKTSRSRALGRMLAGLAAVATLTLVSACNDFLDPRPNDVLAPENFYKTSSDAIAATNAVYEQAKWSYWLAFWYMSDVATDDIIASANFGSDGHRASNYTFDATDWMMDDIWSNAYKTINRANAVIGRVPGITMDETLRSRLVGEAKFLRALSYFNLVRYYGDVPLIDKEVTSLQGLDVARTPAADVYALIVKDLKEAAPTLPASYSGSDVGRVTNGAALSLLAKVYLQEKDYANAAATANEVIATNRYALNATWKDNFRIADEMINPESIFEINYDGVLDPGSGSVMMLFSLPQSFPGGDSYGLMQVAPSLVNLFAPGDQRGNHGSFMISPYTDAMGRTATWAMPPGAAVDKWLDETDTQNMTARAWGGQSNNWIVLRYADVLLMYAEAVNAGGPASGMSAEAALNLVRQRAGIPAVSGLSTTALRDSIRLERRREFVFEGQRWFDLVRWGALDAAIQAKTAEVSALFPGETTVHGTSSLVLPIPQPEINADPKLTQNPGW